MGEYVVGITGASGAIYGCRLTEFLTSEGHDVRLVVSAAGILTLMHECNTTPEELAKRTGAHLEDNSDIAARSASGSAKIDAVIICPCSGTTIGKIANGISDNLVTRSAVVAMKERRPLIIIPRETPYATVHLEMMTRLSTYGVVVLPASPAFYSHPEGLEDMVDFIVARILDHLDIEHSLGMRWSGDELN